MKRYVFDSYAFLALFQEEPGALAVAQILEEISLENAEGFMSAINLGEVYYILCRKSNETLAGNAVKEIHSFGISISVFDGGDCMEAARLKARYNISYADAFAAQLSIRIKGGLVTGDPEFEAMKNHPNFHVIPLTPKPKKKK